jgi:hypothetical protein
LSAFTNEFSFLRARAKGTWSSKRWFFQRGTDGLKETFLEITVASVDEYLKTAESAGERVIKPKGPYWILHFSHWSEIQKETSWGYGKTSRERHVNIQSKDFRQVNAPLNK